MNTNKCIKADNEAISIKLSKPKIRFKANGNLMDKHDK